MDWLERLKQGPTWIPLGGEIIEVLRWTHTRCHQEAALHRHAFYEISRVGAGSKGWFTVDGQERAIGAGDLLIARPGALHGIVSGESTELEIFSLWFRWAPAPAAGPDETGEALRAFAERGAVVARDEERRVATLWNALRSVASGPPRVAQEAQIGALIAALVLAVAQAAAPVPALPEPDSTDRFRGDITIQVAIRYIHSNLHRPLNLPDVAAHAHVSPRHLSRVFAHAAGTSPAAYIARARLEWARFLLTDTDRPIKEIAAVVGYSDVQHFTHAFSRHFGRPPGHYRRNPDVSRSERPFNHADRPL